MKRYGFSLDDNQAAEIGAYAYVKGFRSIGDLAKHTMIQGIARNAPTRAQQAEIDRSLGKKTGGPYAVLRGGDSGTTEEAQG
jgi:hypothetical protein